MDEPWTTRVKCQAPGCGREQAVERPGLVRPGWLLLVTQARVLDAKKNPSGQPAVRQLPFCGLTCLHKWTAARLPSKRKEEA